MNKELLRLVTIGSVDDGKSTLIGRLLFDSGSVYEDQVESVTRASKERGFESLDFSLFTDGLAAEQEKRITIDVAYRYFETERRKFILADCPGHFEYTRNMFTGSSTANVALILIDAQEGIQEQTKRHAYIASLLQVSHLVLCVNKMDKANYDQKVFDNIVESFREFSSKLDINDIHFIPMSALCGDGVVTRSANMPWYDGPTLSYLLDNIHISGDGNNIDARFPIQMVFTQNDRNMILGRVASGSLRKGDEVMVLPSGITSRILEISLAKSQLNEASVGMSVAIELEDDIQVMRGDMLVRINNRPQVGTQFDVMMCWLDDQPFDRQKSYLIRQTSKETKAAVSEVIYKVDIHSLSRMQDTKEVVANDIIRARIITQDPVCFDTYRNNKSTGSIILIDPETNNTVAAGMIHSYVDR
ncbi:MAG: GTP-binding protein [Candidatus Uhrbacteria bacterium]|nr:GTP-binding protein [Candidatus Uhrbacteria bacterium]